MKHSCSVLFVVVVLAAVQPVAACGPYPYLMQFWNDWAPDDLERFCAGEIGIPGTRFDLELAWITWRHLEGLPVPASCFTPDEPAIPAESGEQLWLEARKAISPNGPRWMDTVRHEQRPSADGRYTDYVSYENCLDDAFHTATATLEARMAAYGAADPNVAEWLRGQDTVFANCDDGADRPDEPDPSWPDWLIADREYQIAAARFYAGDWKETIAAFREIAADPASPWQETADFVVARALGRAGRWDEAIVHLERLLADPTRSAWHPAATRVRAHLRHRAFPDDVATEIAERLAAAKLPADYSQDLIDLGRLLGSDSSDDPLVGYLRTVTLVRPTDAEHAVTRWQEGGPISWWLAAAIAHQRVTDKLQTSWHPPWAPDFERRIGESLLDRVPEATGSAGLAITFHRLRLLSDSGRLAEGEDDLASWLDRSDLAASDRNRLLDFHRRLAPDLTSFVRRSLRHPTNYGWDYDGNGRIAAGDEGEGLGALRLLDRVAAERLGREPLESLLTVALDEEMPPLVAKQILSATLTRAVLAGHIYFAVEVALELAPRAPELASALREFAAEPPPSRPFAGAMLLLGGPGFDPFIHGGLGRGAGPETLPLTEIDSLGANWWCAGGPDAEADLTGVEGGDWGHQALNPAPVVLGHLVLEWADEHTDDPRVPEALHRLVRATRYACGRGVGDFTEVSRGAFQRLHQRYPKSRWTKETPYWFE